MATSGTNQWGTWQLSSNLGETATETFISQFGQAGPQEGLPAANAVTSITNLASNALQTFTWE